MAKVEFAVENKVVDPGDFPKLKLKVGERARISLVETAPEFAFVHTIRKPIIGDDGKFVTEERTGKRGTYTVTTTDFVGQHICFGDPEKLISPGSGGVDPDNCPTCEASIHQEGIGKPERRFATHVLQYACQPGSFNPSQPISVRLVVWTFGEKRYGELADMAEAWKDNGGLRFRDIELGPCEAPEVFQKFTMAASPKTVWTSEPNAKAMGIEVYKNNQVPDLEACIARRVTKQQALQDIAKVKEAYDIGNGVIPQPSNEGVDASVADILAGFEAEGGTTVSAPVETVDDALAGMFDDAKMDMSQVAETPAPAEPAAADPAPEAVSAADEGAAPQLDLDAMLNDLTN